jgi:hypothetical protein
VSRQRAEIDHGYGGETYSSERAGAGVNEDWLSAVPGVDADAVEMAGEGSSDTVRESGDGRGNLWTSGRDRPWLRRGDLLERAGRCRRQRRLALGTAPVRTFSPFARSYLLLPSTST